jgi:hypothetical protein
MMWPTCYNFFTNLCRLIILQAVALDEEGIVDDTVYPPAMVAGAAANPAYPPPANAVTQQGRCIIGLIFFALGVPMPLQHPQLETETVSQMAKNETTLSLAVAQRTSSFNSELNSHKAATCINQIHPLPSSKQVSAIK